MSALACTLGALIAAPGAARAWYPNTGFVWSDALYAQNEYPDKVFGWKRQRNGTVAWVPSESRSTASDCDDCFQTVSLPFPMPYYGNVYSAVRIHSNGFIELTNDTATTTGGSPFNNDLIRYDGLGRQSSALIAPWWDDWNPTKRISFKPGDPASTLVHMSSNYQGIFYAQSGAQDAFIVTWRHILPFASAGQRKYCPSDPFVIVDPNNPNAGSCPGGWAFMERQFPYTFEVILKNNGTFRFNYVHARSFQPWDRSKPDYCAGNGWCMPGHDGAASGTVGYVAGDTSNVFGDGIIFNETTIGATPSINNANHLDDGFFIDFIDPGTQRTLGLVADVRGAPRAGVFVTMNGVTGQTDRFGRYEFAGVSSALPVLNTFACQDPTSACAAKSSRDAFGNEIARVPGLSTDSKVRQAAGVRTWDLNWTTGLTPAPDKDRSRCFSQSGAVDARLGRACSTGLQFAGTSYLDVYTGSGSDGSKPIVLVPGLDPLNTDGSAYYYAMFYPQLEKLLDEGMDLRIGNYGDGSVSLPQMDNEVGMWINDTKSVTGRKPQAVGVSQGGIVLRHTIQGSTTVASNLAAWYSLDAPQKGANIDGKTQAHIFCHKPPTAGQKLTLFSTPAKQLLFHTVGAKGCQCVKQEVSSSDPKYLVDGWDKEGGTNVGFVTRSGGTIGGLSVSGWSDARVGVEYESCDMTFSQHDEYYGNVDDLIPIGRSAASVVDKIGWPSIPSARYAISNGDVSTKMPQTVMGPFCDRAPGVLYHGCLGNSESTCGADPKCSWVPAGQRSQRTKASALYVYDYVNSGNCGMDNQSGGFAMKTIDGQQVSPANNPSLFSRAYDYASTNWWSGSYYMTDSMVRASTRSSLNWFYQGLATGVCHSTSSSPGLDVSLAFPPAFIRVDSALGMKPGSAQGTRWNGELEDTAGSYSVLNPNSDGYWTGWVGNASNYPHCVASDHIGAQVRNWVRTNWGLTASEAVPPAPPVAPDITCSSHIK